MTAVVSTLRARRTADLTAWQAGFPLYKADAAHWHLAKRNPHLHVKNSTI